MATLASSIAPEWKLGDTVAILKLPGNVRDQCWQQQRIGKGEELNKHCHSPLEVQILGEYAWGD